MFGKDAMLSWCPRSNRLNKKSSLRSCSATSWSSSCRYSVFSMATHMPIKSFMNDAKQGIASAMVFMTLMRGWFSGFLLHRMSWKEWQERMPYPFFSFTSPRVTNPGTCDGYIYKGTRRSWPCRRAGTTDAARHDHAGESQVTNPAGMAGGTRRHRKRGNLALAAVLLHAPPKADRWPRLRVPWLPGAILHVGCAGDGTCGQGLRDVQPAHRECRCSPRRHA